MADVPQPMIGGCRCGAVRFRVDASPLLTMVCHCTGCQRMTGGAFSTSVAVPTPSFTVTQGDTVIGGLRGDQARHHHCDWCKSWLFTHVEPEMGFTNVRASMLDDTSWFAPLIETYTSEAFPWAKTGARHSYAEFPPMEAYQALVAEYAALRG